MNTTATPATDAEILAGLDAALAAGTMVALPTSLHIRAAVDLAAAATGLAAADAALAATPTPLRRAVSLATDEVGLYRTRVRESAAALDVLLAQYGRRA